MGISLLLATFASMGIEAGGFPSRAGSSACVDGSPGGPGSSTHGRLGIGNGGFSLSFSPDLPSPSTYSPNTQYTITLSGGSFVGFAISPISFETGSLAPGANSQSLDACTSFSDADGLTHTNSAVKQSASGFWTAPASGTASIRWT